MSTKETKSSSRDLLNNINSHHDNITFSELYQNDIWFTIIVFIIVIIISIYFFIISSLSSYKMEWDKNKCNPLLMPFASIINNEDSIDNEFLYIINNFNECLNTLNAELAFEAKNPLDDILASIKNFFGLLYQMFIDVIKFIVYLFELILQFFKMILDKLKGLLLHIKLFFINTNDFLSRILSMFTVIFYTIVLLIRSWKLMFVVFVFGWLLTIVIPASISLFTVLTLLITTIVSFFTALPIFIVGTIIALGFIPSIVIYGTSFVIALVYFLIVLIIYVIFSNFVKELL